MLRSCCILSVSMSWPGQPHLTLTSSIKLSIKHNFLSSLPSHHFLCLRLKVRADFWVQHCKKDGVLVPPCCGLGGDCRSCSSELYLLTLTAGQSQCTAVSAATASAGRDWSETLYYSEIPHSTN